MDLLTQIKLFLESLDSNSTDLDIDHLRTILSEAYEVSRQGLELSNDARKYRELKKNYDELSSNFSSSAVLLNSLKNENDSLKSSFEEISPFIENLRSDLQAKIKLIQKYSPEKKTKLTSDVISADIKKLVALKIDVYSDFNSDWSELGDQEIKGKPQFIDFTPFKIGD